MDEFEAGVFAQVGPVGGALGFDINNGFTLSGFISGSIGAAFDVWGAWSVKPSNFTKGGQLEGFTPYVGIGTPIGTPGVTATGQKNVYNGSEFATFGFGISAVFAVGI